MSTFFDRAYTELCTLLTQLQPTPPRLLLGFSGGADSVFLLHLLARAAREHAVVVYAAHLNHAWRTDAQENADFCVAQAAACGIPCVTGQLSTYEAALKKTGSQEDFGRRARHAFFADVAHKYELNWRILGHHADDQAETFIMRIIRGTSLEGLVGMEAQRTHTLRPLLGYRKQEIVAELERLQIPWYHDTTNESPKHLRNRIRNTVIPALEMCDSRSITQISELQKSLSVDNDYLTMATDEAYQRVFADTPGHGSLTIFRSLHAALKNRLISRILFDYKFSGTLSKALIDEVLRFLLHPHGGTHTVGNLLFYKKGSHFWCEKK